MKGSDENGLGMGMKKSVTEHRSIIQDLFAIVKLDVTSLYSKDTQQWSVYLELMTKSHLVYSADKMLKTFSSLFCQLALFSLYLCSSFFVLKSFI